MLWKRKKIQLTPAFDNILAMYKQLEAPLLEEEKAEIMLYYLVEKDAPKDYRLLDMVVQTLFPREKKNTGKPQKAFDFLQDAQYIYAAFLQVYGIDLFEQQGRLHWWKFNALLQALPDDTKFTQIVQIRLRPMPNPNKHNAEERAQLARLKMQYQLKISEEERQQNLQDGLAKIVRCLLSMAKKDEKKGEN